MSVIVKGMDMPFSCYECPLVHRAFNGVETELYCYALEKAVSDEDRTRDDECPLVEVPTPHGRLIDFDKFLEEYPQFVLIPASSILLENEPVIEAEE